MTARPALVLAFRGRPKRLRRDKQPAIARKFARLEIVRPNVARVVERLIDDLLADTAKYTYGEGA